jgi:hypothetical protein
MICPMILYFFSFYQNCLRNFWTVLNAYENHGSYILKTLISWVCSSKICYVIIVLTMMISLSYYFKIWTSIVKTSINYTHIPLITYKLTLWRIPIQKTIVNYWPLGPLALIKKIPECHIFFPKENATFFIVKMIYLCRVWVAWIIKKKRNKIEEWSYLKIKVGRRPTMCQWLSNS